MSIIFYIYDKIIMQGGIVLKNKLTLQNLFKIFSSQTKLEILITIFDNNLTASEIANRLNKDLSTIYRHLVQLKNIGILKSKRVKGIEYFDFSSTKVFQLIENAIEFLNEINGEHVIDCSSLKECFFAKSPNNLNPDYVLDVRGEICPVPDIKTRKMLETLEEGKILLVIVDYPLSAERISISVSKMGSKVLAKISEKAGEVKIFIQK